MITPSCCFPKNRGFRSDRWLPNQTSLQWWHPDCARLKGQLSSWLLFPDHMEETQPPTVGLSRAGCWQPRSPGPCGVDNCLVWEEGLRSFLFYSVCISKQLNIWNKYLLAHNGLEHMLACFRGCKSEDISVGFHSPLHFLSVFGFLYTRHRLYNSWHLLSKFWLIKKIELHLLEMSKVTSKTGISEAPVWEQAIRKDKNACVDQWLCNE